MKKKKKSKTVRLKKSVRIVLAILSLFFVILSLWIMIDCFDTKKETKKFVMAYKSEANASYKVYLKANNYFSEKYLDMDKKYISNLIDYIDIDFSYIFSSSKLLNSKYTYKVTATLVNENDSVNIKGEIWSKVYNLVPTKIEASSDTTNVSIKENIKVSYDSYNNEVKNFNKDYSILSKAVLYIKFDVVSTNSVKSYEKDIVDVSNVEIKIPLLQNVTEVVKSDILSKNESVYNHTTVEEKFNLVLFLISLLLFLLTLPLGVISTIRLFIITNMSEYITSLNKILKNYDEIIAEVTNEPNLKDKDIIEIKKFEDLVNIEEELRIPILLYEVKKGSLAWFVIVHNDKAYRYTLKQEIKTKSAFIRKIEGYKI